MGAAESAHGRGADQGVVTVSAASQDGHRSLPSTSEDEAVLASLRALDVQVQLARPSPQKDDACCMWRMEICAWRAASTNQHHRLWKKNKEKKNRK